MTEEQALVVEVNGDYAIIETMRKSTCGSCGVNQACGTSLLAKVIGNKRARVSARNTVGARVGETVVVGVDDKAIVSGSSLVYALPLASMFLTALLAGWVCTTFGYLFSEGIQILSSLFGLLIGFFLANRIARTGAMRGKFEAKILRKAETELRFYETKSVNAGQ